MDQDDCRTEVNRLRRGPSWGTTHSEVLVSLHLGERYGDELLKQIEDLGKPVREVKEGTLHLLRHRQEEAGEVRSQWRPIGRGRPRRDYRLTQSGRARLALFVDEWSTYLQDARDLLARSKGVER